MNKLKLLTMSDIPAEEVRWLWYPYLPRGKITIIQGDPGEGKTTFVLALAALLTRGLPMPGCTESRPPMNIIYQMAEDSLADTVKPRLTALGADCSRVLVIDKSERELTLSDHRIAQAIQETGAGLLVLDPIQAYLGEGVDMHRANEVRPIFKRLGQLEEQTGCAIMLVGHMNKMQGAKSAYRGLAGRRRGAYFWWGAPRMTPKPEWWYTTRAVWLRRWRLFCSLCIRTRDFPGAGFAIPPPANSSPAAAPV